MAAPQPSALPVPVAPRRLTARALLLGERIDTVGLERSEMISTNPLAFRVGGHGEVVLFRYGVAVLFGLSPVEEDEVLRGLRPRIIAPFDRYEDETATIEVVTGRRRTDRAGRSDRRPRLVAAAPPGHRRCPWPRTWRSPVTSAR